MKEFIITGWPVIIGMLIVGIMQMKILSGAANSFEMKQVQIDGTKKLPEDFSKDKISKGMAFIAILLGTIMATLVLIIRSFLVMAVVIISVWLISKYYIPEYVTRNVVMTIIFLPLTIFILAAQETFIAFKKLT